MSFTLHVVLFLEIQRLAGRKLLELLILHPFVISLEIQPVKPSESSPLKRESNRIRTGTCFA